MKLTDLPSERRSFLRVMVEVNSELAAIHKRMPLSIDIARYEPATDYISQFISYTTIWNLKFTYNLENPEVALMQIMHLEYIFSHEPADTFMKERTTLAEMTKLFMVYTPYSTSLIDIRKKRFMHHIEQAYNHS